MVIDEGSRLSAWKCINVPKKSDIGNGTRILLVHTLKFVHGILVGKYVSQRKEERIGKNT